MAVLPTPESIEAYAAEDDGQPVVMFNLLRVTDGNRELYDEYSRRVLPILARYGVEVVYADPEYLEVAELRSRGLEDSLLQATRELFPQPAGG